ncbi:MAG: hypothetical protein AAFQ82_20205, partial [Myxococcota bacterium]
MADRPEHGGAPAPVDPDDTTQESRRAVASSLPDPDSDPDTDFDFDIDVVDPEAVDEATRFDIRISMQQPESDFGADTDIRYVPPGFAETGEVDGSHLRQVAEAIVEIDPSKTGSADPVIAKAPPRAVQSIEVGQCFARGGMAELYHARRIGGEQHKKRFVMKKLLKELAKDPTYVERFKNEAKVTAGLRHPHIIETY